MSEDNLEMQKARGDFVLGEEEEIEQETESVEENEEEESSEDENDTESEGSEESEQDEEETLDEDEDEGDQAEDNNKGIKIPKSRLDKVIAQREAEKARVEWLEQQLETLIEKGMGKQSAPEPVEETKETFDFVTAEEKYADLILAGESAKAAKLRADITSEQTKAILDEVSGLGKKASSDALEQTQTALQEAKFEATVETLETQFPFLDYNSGDYNEEAVDTINNLMTGYVSQGVKQSEALRQAVEKMAPLYSKDTEEVVTTKAKRSKAAKTKSVKASNSQPPETTGTLKEGQSEEINISKLSRKEFKSLSAKEKAILRGDIL